MTRTEKMSIPSDARSVSHAAFMAYNKAHESGAFSMCTESNISMNFEIDVYREKSGIFYAAVDTAPAANRPTIFWLPAS